MTSGSVDHAWSLRVRWVDGHARAYARAQSFDVVEQASLRESDPHPSAIEYLLGALGADLAWGLRRAAERRSLVIHDLELSLAGRLDNALVHFGVIGERGHAGLKSVTGAAYVSAEADSSEVEEAWREAIERSPSYQTLSRAADISIALRIV